MFRIGEKVAFLNDTTKGVVQSISGNQVVVMTDYGFEETCDASELVSQESALDGLTSYIPEHRMDEVKEAKYQSEKKKKSVAHPKRKEIPPIIIDLHIEKLVKSTRQMSNGEIVDYQIRYAQACIDNARRNRQKRLIFIHGVGEGVLKSELKYLFTGYMDIDFFEADYYKFGQGATEVRLR